MPFLLSPTWRVHLPLISWSPHSFPLNWQIQLPLQFLMDYPFTTRLHLLSISLSLSLHPIPISHAAITAAPPPHFTGTKVLSLPDSYRGYDYNWQELQPNARPTRHLYRVLWYQAVCQIWNYQNENDNKTTPGHVMTFEMIVWRNKTENDKRCRSRPWKF